MIAFDLNGSPYEKRSKTSVGYAENMPEFVGMPAAPVFQWPDWAVRSANALIREGFKIETAIRKVRSHLTPA